jgi:hypothetical protein
MIGPLPTALGGFNRVLVAIDKFTKWIKVKPVTCCQMVRSGQPTGVLVPVV